MRLHEYEDALLEAKKDEANMTKSDYLRNVILFAPAGERARYSSDFAVEICQRLNEIGNRINEIAHAVNGEGTEKVDNTVYIWYNVSIKYRRCFYDRTTAEIDAKSIHGNI